MNKKFLQKLAKFRQLADEFEGLGYDLEELIRERHQLEIYELEDFIELAKKLDAEIYLCSDPHLNFDHDGINYYTSAECEVQHYLYSNDIRFKIV